jgi:predicted dehydrogenase
MGSFHAASWARTPAQVVGVMAQHHDQAAALAKSLNTRVYDDLDALINDVDVVDVCTPTDTHHEIVLKAAAASKQVVCEKPLARTYAQGKAMVDACEKAGVNLLVGQVVRFFPEYALAKSVVDEGKIGRVGVMRLKRCGFQPTRETGNWFAEFDRSGGIILDLMIHDFDYARWTAGEVESVYARNVRRGQDAANDYGQAILRHKSGAISLVEGAWAYPAPMFRTGLEIAGDGGLIEHPAGSSVPLEIFLGQTEGGQRADVGVPKSPLLDDPYVMEIQHFYDILSGVDIPLRITAADALAALRIALAAVESARTNRRVRIEEVQ